MPSPTDRERPPSTKGWWSWVWRPLVVLLVTGALGWWMWNGAWFTARTRDRPKETEAPTPAEVVEPERAWSPRPTAKPAPGCKEEAERRCFDGDSWWLDSCGVMYAKAEECGATFCDEGVCEAPPPPGCGGVPVLGECDGDVARGCEAGFPFEVDCGTTDRRCVQTEEGPICAPRSADACEHASASPHCDGDTLISCVQGEWKRFDCRAQGGTCGRAPWGVRDVCLSPPPPLLPEGCDNACGCEPESQDEICDGKDNDADGYIDESGTCEPVDLVVFVIVDEDSSSSYAREDIDAEVARLNLLFAREDDYGIELRLADVVRLSEPQWLELEIEELDKMLRSPTITAAREGFYVPIVFTEKVMYQGTPRPGLSTVPNGTCGGQRRIWEPQPPLGLVAIAKRRWKTTLAHELGHFFGLCHTHADHPAPIVSVSSVDPDSAEVCAEACTIDGDGICDTAEDPGPNLCALDSECGPICDDGSQPDARNIMGYYARCRVGFTEQQALLMRQTIALRRGWHECLRGRGCACELGDDRCPEAMSCRRYINDEGPYRKCWFDGPVSPGGVCTSSHECSAGGMCVRQLDADARCVRPCNDETPACECVDVEGVSHPICIDDLRRETTSSPGRDGDVPQ